MEEALPPRFDALLRLSQSQKIASQSDSGEQRSAAQEDQIGAPACAGAFPARSRPWSMSDGAVLVSTVIDGSCMSVLAKRDAEVGLTRSGSGLSCEAAVFVF